jgi:two-component sensor histidine kinase
MLLHGRPLDGAQLILVGMVDLTERKRMEDEKELLAHELSHRVRNILAVVQALATQTDGEKRSVEEFRQAFIGRLQALSRAHGLLLNTRWQSAELATLIEQIVGPYRSDHSEAIRVEGEPVTLTPPQGLGLSLVLHELSTNAAKYGALANHEGSVHLSWRIEDSDHGRRVHLLWQELGGPTVESPGRKGFGTRLIEQACTHELDGEVELDYRPQGLRCQMVFPLA